MDWVQPQGQGSYVMPSKARGSKMPSLGRRAEPVWGRRGRQEHLRHSRRLLSQSA